MKELAEALKTRAGLRMRQGVVTAVDGSTVSVLIGGSTVPVDGVQHLNSVAPQVDEVVWITSDGADLWIIGTHGDPPPIDPERLPAFETYFAGADPAGDPDPVTGLEGVAAMTGVMLSWDLPIEALWRVWEVYEGTAPGFVPGAPILSTTSAVVTIAHNPASGPWYYKLRAINSRGEASTDVEAGPFTLSALPDVVLGPGSVHAEHMAVGAVDLASAVVTGQLLAAKLADNAVTLAKVDATVTDLIDDAAAAASTADAKAVQAAVDAAAAATAAATADGKAVAAQGDADAAAAAAVTADGKAVAAQSDADAAAQAAADADAAAAAAAGLAATKAVVLYQTETPAAGYQNDTTLWIDTTGGANTPKRWTGAAWAAVTDKAATDAADAAAAASGAAAAAQADADAAATAASTADGKAVAAQADADAAAAAAATADGKAVAAQSTADDAAAAAAAAASTANTALTTANGKNKIVFSTLDASGTAYATGDVWFKKSGDLILAQWEFVAGAWSARTLDNAVIANLNAGKLTAGTIHVDRIAAGSILAAKLNVGDVQAAVVTAAVVNALALNAGSITAGTLDVARIAAGSIVAAKLDVADVQAAVVTAAKVNTLALSAGAITAGTLDVARIAAGAILAEKLDVASVQAAVVTADKVNTLALSAAVIQSGTIDTARLNATEIQAAVVTAAKINSLTINAVQITGGAISGTTITGVTIRSIATATRVTLGEGGCAINIFEGTNVNPGQISLVSGSLGLSSRDDGYGVGAILIGPNTAGGYGEIALGGNVVALGSLDVFGAGNVDGALDVGGSCRVYGRVNSETNFPGVSTGWNSVDGIWIQENSPSVGNRWKMTYNASARTLSLSRSTVRHVSPVFTVA